MHLISKKIKVDGNKAKIIETVNQLYPNEY